jgi:integrase
MYATEIQAPEIAQILAIPLRREMRASLKSGSRRGNWLTKEEAGKLYQAPDRGTWEGRRDAAILALLLGCGLRRGEMSKATAQENADEESRDGQMGIVRWGNYQERDGRMCLVDIVGKGGRIRTIPVPAWARKDLDAWREEQGVGGDYARDAEDRRFVLDKGIGKPEAYGANWVWERIKGLCVKAGVREIAPHDLRRTIARLMYKNGADLKQIQVFLGHAEVRTTEQYVGAVQALQEGLAAIDKVEMGEEREVKR